MTTDDSGGFIYTPNAGYYGADSFDYTIDDGEDSATGTMTFNVSPVPPTSASFSGSTSLVQGDTASLSLSYVPGTETDDDVSWTVTNPGGVVIASGSDTQISFIADAVGAYYVSATVTDPLYAEASTSASAQINVTARVGPTSVRFGGTTSAYVGDTVTLGVSYTAGSSTNDNVTWTVDDSAGNLIASGSGTSVRFPAIALLGEPLQIALSCDAGAAQYREFAPAFNTLAEGWHASVVGRFRPEIEPFSRPKGIADDVDVEFPVLAWNAHRTESGMICLWVAHTPAGACFQATCDRGDMATLLKKLERKLGITFTPYFDGKMAAESGTPPNNG